MGTTIKHTLEIKDSDSRMIVWKSFQVDEHTQLKKTVQVSNFEFSGVLRSPRVAPDLNELLHFGNACGTTHQDDLIHLVLLQS